MSRRKPDVEDFYKLSKSLKAAGDKKMRERLNKSMKGAVKPVIPKVKAKARADLPAAGGLNKLVAKARVTPQVRTGRNNYGVRLVVNGDAARSANKGTIRHPVPSKPGTWVDQKVPSGWFDDPCDAEKPVIRKNVQAALRQVMDDIARGV